MDTLMPSALAAIGVWVAVAFSFGVLAKVVSSRLNIPKMVGGNAGLGVLWCPFFAAKKLKGSFLASKDNFPFPITKSPFF
jgi:hypothetical protein